MTPGNPGNTLRQRAALLSLGAALLVLLLKLGAYALTGSVALLSDAAESITNVAAALALLFSLRLSLRPPDYEHPYGHQKAEYLSSAFEGSLILLAAGMILVTALGRITNPPPLEGVADGVGVALLATLLNGVVAWFLARTAAQTESVALAANARHLLTDVWTSVGVIVAVALVALSGRTVLDPVIAVLVALNIVREGWRVMAGALSDLLDARLPDSDEAKILAVLDGHPQVLGYHRLRSRRAGTGRFAEIDIFVAPDFTVLEAHEVAAELERDLAALLPRLVATLHVEPFVAGLREGATPPREEFRRG